MNTQLNMDAYLDIISNKSMGLISSSLTARWSGSQASRHHRRRYLFQAKLTQLTECSKAVIFVHNSHLGRLMNITLLCQKSNQINILILSNDPTVKSSHCQASGNVTDIQQMSGHLWTSPIRCWHVSDVTHRGMSEHRSSHLTWHH